MTRTEAMFVRNQVVVNAAITPAFTAFTEQFGDFKPPEHNLLQARPPRRCSSRASVGTSTTARPTAVSAAGHASWPTNPQWQVETDPELTSEGRGPVRSSPLTAT
jgi:hypothetical protein